MKKHLIFSLLGLFAFVGMASAQGYTFNTDLYLGSQGSDVASLQSYLISNGYNIPSIASGATPKGYFGTQTKAALAAYQSSVGINPSGYFGPATRGWISAHGDNGNGQGNNGGGNSYNPIRVISPNGGETWQKGTTQTITWVGAPGILNQTGTIKLEYPTPACAQPGQPIRCMIMVRAPITIAANINLNAGSYNWNVGTSIQNGIGTYGIDTTTITDGQYKIQVCSADSSVCDDSDNTFTVTSNYVNPGNGSYSPIISGIDAPTSLAINQLGTWTVHASDPQNGYLSYSVDWGDNGCATGYVCSANAPASQAFAQQTTFTHSYSTPGNYTVKFTVRNASGYTAQSNASIQITNGNYNNGGAGPLQITSPNGGEIWQRGTTHSITWTSPYYFAAAYADLKVTQKYNCTTQICPMIAYAPYTIATNISINQNSYSWNVGSAMNYNGQLQTLPDGQYSVQICQTGTSSCDSSDNTFTITSSGGGYGNSQITVTSPNGGEVWQANSTHPITWTNSSYLNGSYYSNAVDMYLISAQVYSCPMMAYPSTGSSCGNPTTYALDRNISSNSTYNWIVGTDINNNVIPAGNYSLEICPAGSTSNCDTSNSYFTIVGTAYPAVNQGGSYYPTYGTGSYNTGYTTGYNNSNSICPAGYICTPVSTTGYTY